MKTHHSILYIVLINSYDHRFIENITLPILNRHKIVGLVKAGILMILAKLLQTLHHKCKNLHIFAKNHTCFWFVQIMLCRHCRGLSFVLSVMYMMYNSPNLTLNKPFIRRLPDIYEKCSPFFTNIYKFI